MNNLQQCFEYLYEKANHPIEKDEGASVVHACCASYDYNFVFRSKMPPTPKMTESIEQSLRKVSNLDFPFLLVQDHQTDPVVRELFSNAGFSFVGNATCVSMDHCRVAVPVKQPGDKYALQRVENDVQLNDWCRIVDNSFSMKEGSSSQVMKPARAYLFGSDSRHRLYVLYGEDHTPVSSSLLFLPENKNDDAGHYCWGTVENQRKRGAMTYLVASMIRMAKEQGYQRSVAQCYDASLALAEGLGFQVEGELDIYSNAAFKSSP